jgi:hypothetical protein
MMSPLMNGQSIFGNSNSANNGHEDKDFYDSLNFSKFKSSNTAEVNQMSGTVNWS